jgi:cytochrome c oxidase subunit II
MLWLATFIPFFAREASRVAPKVDALFLFETAVTVFFSTLIFILIIVFAVKYRRRSPDEVPVQIHGDLGLELTWIVIPAIIVAVMFVWGAKLFILLARPPRDAVHVYIVGKQWMWKIQHPGGAEEIDMLHIPVGEPVECILTSQDVIHDFSVPAFRVKKDALPDRYTTVWFTADKVGQYPFYCDQFCGTFHSHMRGYVDVMPRSSYETWLAGEAAHRVSMVDEGAQLYQTFGCITCHGAGKGPSWVGLWNSKVHLANGQVVVADGTYIRNHILDPRDWHVEGYPNIMPTFQGQITEEQIFDLIAYIQSLATTPGPQGVPVPPPAKGRASTTP